MTAGVQVRSFRSIKLLLGACLLLLVMVASASGQAPAPGGHIVFRCAKLIDPASGTVLENAAVEVGNGRILRVGKADQVAAGKDVQVIDFGSRYLIPGLIETHGHLYTNLIQGHSSNELLPSLYLAGGITSVFAPGSFNPEGDIAIRDRIDAGVRDGARIFLAGEYLQMNAPPGSGMANLTTVDEVKLRIDQWAARGVVAVKVYNGMRGELLNAAVAHAHQRGLRVVAHVGAVTYAEAIAAGIDVLYHGFYALPEVTPAGMPLEAIGMINTDFAPPEYAKYYKALSEVDLHQPAVTGMLQQAAQARVVFGPTIVALQPQDKQSTHLDDQKRFFSAEAWKKVEMRATTPERPYARAVYGKNLEFTHLAHEAGVLLTIGTDLTNLQEVPQFAFWHEMEIFSKAGLPPMEVLKAATSNGAYAIGRSDVLGSIAPGKYADFVVLDADPLQNISNVRSVYRVVKNGVVYEPEKLLRPVLGKVH